MVIPNLFYYSVEESTSDKACAAPVLSFALMCSLPSFDSSFRSNHGYSVSAQSFGRNFHKVPKAFAASL